jgi:hypothetical protein
VALKLAYPAFADFVCRNGIDEVQFFAALPLPGNEIRLLEKRQVLGDCLARHMQSLAKIAERLAILPVQPIQQLPAACVRQRVKHGVFFQAQDTQLFSCLFIGNRMVACQAPCAQRCRAHSTRENGFGAGAVLRGMSHHGRYLLACTWNKQELQNRVQALTANIGYHLMFVGSRACPPR